VPLASLLERVGEEIRTSGGKDVRVTAPVGLTVTGDPIALAWMVAT
jgi:hypothetical protein